MNFSEYQREAMKFAKYDSFDYPFMALTEEVGEVFGKLAKYSRKNNASLSCIVENIQNPDAFLNDVDIEFKKSLTKELGDVLWQLQACCSELGLNLNDVAELNLQKLGDRDERGVIVGEGDNR